MTTVEETRAPQPDRISRDERRELKAAIKLQIKVAGDEIEQRKAQLDSEVSDRLRERFAAQDAAVAAFNDAVAVLKRETEEKLQSLMDTSALNDLGGGRWSEARHSGAVCIYAPTWQAESKASMAAFLRGKLNAELSGARLQLSRQESALMSELIRDALASHEAINFLDRVEGIIDNVLPSYRVAELESAYEAGDRA